MWQEGRGRACRCAVAGEGLRRGMGCGVGGCASGLRACIGTAVAIESARRGRVAVRGREEVFGGECIAQSAGVHRAACGRASALRGGAEVLGKGVSLCGVGEELRRGMGCEVGGECIAQPAGVRRCAGACVGAAWGSGSARRGRVAVRGRAKVFGGECVVRAAGLTHIRRSSTRARVLLYIRPPCPRREIAAMGPKDAPCEYPSPAKASAPAPSAFALPRPRSHFPRPRSHFRARVHTSPAWPSAAPTKTSASRSSSYPQWVIHGKVIHIVSPHLVQNVLASRLRTRIYNISFARRPLPGSVRAAPEKSPRRCDPVSRTAVRRVGEGKAKADAPSRSAPHFPRLRPSPCPPTAPPPPPKWAPRLRRREGKRPNGAPPHHNAHTPNAARKRYLHNSRTMTQRRTKRCAQFVIFVFTPCKLLHNFSTVLHRSPRDVPKRAQIAARRPDFPCFTARFSPFPPESHCAKHPRTAPVLPPKNAPLRAYAKPRPHSRVRGTRQHATTCAFFTFSARYERRGGTRNANFCPAEGRKWGRFRSQMLKNGLQTKKSTFSFGRLVI